jgi:outer membrane protein
MKPIHVLTILFLLAGVSCAYAESTGQSTADIPKIWTAEQAVAFSIAENPNSSVAIKRIEEAQASAAIAHSSNYPLVNISAEYGQTNNPMYSFGNILNQGGFDNSIDFNDPGKTDNLQVKALIQYRFYNGGRDQADQESAGAHINISETDLIAVHQQLSFEVVKTFQAIIQAENMVIVRKESLASISAAVEVSKARYEAGDLLRQDLLNLELQQSRASENLIRSIHSLELTKRSFLSLLGLREGQVTVDPEIGSDQLIPENIDYQNRHELKKLEGLEQAAIAEFNKAEGANKPTIDGFASYQVDHGWELDETGDSWIAGVLLNYTLFDGKKSSSQIAMSRLKIQEIHALKQKMELALNFEVQKAQLDYEQSRERLSVTEKMVGVAEEVARLSRARFKEGVILASDLIDFEMRVTDAKSRHLDAKAGYQVAIANLRRVAGLEQFSTQ